MINKINLESSYESERDLTLVPQRRFAWGILGFVLAVHLIVLLVIWYFFCSIKVPVSWIAPGTHEAGAVYGEAGSSQKLSKAEPRLIKAQLVEKHSEAKPEAKKDNRVETGREVNHEINHQIHQKINQTNTPNKQNKEPENKQDPQAATGQNQNLNRDTTSSSSRGNTNSLRENSNPQNKLSLPVADTYEPQKTVKPKTKSKEENAKNAPDKLVANKVHKEGTERKDGNEREESRAHKESNVLASSQNTKKAVNSFSTASTAPKTLENTQAEAKEAAKADVKTDSSAIDAKNTEGEFQKSKSGDASVIDAKAAEGESEASRLLAGDSLPVASEGELKLLSGSQLVYPKLCQRRGISGRVVIELTLNADGVPIMVRTLEKSGRCPEFTDEAIRYGKSRRYMVPRDRYPHGVRIILGISFQLR